MSTFNNLDSKRRPATEYQSQSWQCSVYKVIEFQISNSMLNSKPNSNINRVFHMVSPTLLPKCCRTSNFLRNILYKVHIYFLTKQCVRLGKPLWVVSHMWLIGHLNLYELQQSWELTFFKLYHHTNKKWGIKIFFTFAVLRNCIFKIFT